MRLFALVPGLFHCARLPLAKPSRYYDCKYSILETTASGEQVENVQYTNGEGLFTLAKPYLYWDDYEEWAGVNCEFEKHG